MSTQAWVYPSSKVLGAYDGNEIMLSRGRFRRSELANIDIAIWTLDVTSIS